MSEDVLSRVAIAVGLSEADPRARQRRDQCLDLLRRLTSAEQVVEVRGYSVGIDIDPQSWRIARVSIAPSLRYLFLAPWRATGAGTVGSAHARWLADVDPVRIYFDVGGPFVVCSTRPSVLEHGGVSSVISDSIIIRESDESYAASRAP